MGKVTSMANSDHVRIFLRYFGFQLCIYATNVTPEIAGAIQGAVALLASHGVPVSMQEEAVILPGSKH